MSRAGILLIALLLAGCSGAGVCLLDEEDPRCLVAKAEAATDRPVPPSTVELLLGTLGTAALNAIAAHYSAGLAGR